MSTEALPLKETPPRRRRWIPLSLRIVGVLALVGLALALWFAIPIFRQQVVIREIERAGGSVQTAHAPPDWLSSSLGERYAKFFDQVEFVDFENANPTDETVALLSRLPRLKALLLAGPRVTDAGLADVGRLTNLTWLALDGPQFNDGSLDQIAGLGRLELLRLNAPQITDWGLRHVADMTSIQWLDLTSTQLTDAGIAYVVRLPNLRVLELAKTQITDEGLRRLETLTKLKKLDLRSTQVTDDGVAELRHALPSVQIDHSHTDPAASEIPQSPE